MTAPHGQREHDDKHERDRYRAEQVDEVTELRASFRRLPPPGRVNVPESRVVGDLAA